MSKTIYKSIDGKNTDLVLVEFDKNSCFNDDNECYYFRKGIQCPCHGNKYISLKSLLCEKKVFGTKKSFIFIKAFE